MSVTLATFDGTWVNPTTYDAGEVRRADAAIFASAGIASGLEVSVDASDNVTVTAGYGVIDGDTYATGTGVYRGGPAADATDALDARDATYPRVDLVVLRQYDPDVTGTGTAYEMTVEVITGTPAASPSAPALPDLAEELARLEVPVDGGGAVTVDTSNRVEARAIGAPAYDVPRMVSERRLIGVTADVDNVTSISFPAGTGFTAAPSVFLSFEDGSPIDNFVSPYNITTSGFDMTIRTNATKSMYVHYFAVGS